MYKMIFYAGLLLFMIGLVTTTVLFIKNHIAKVIGDLTGWNAKKAMKELQKEKKGKNALKDSLEQPPKKMQKRKPRFRWLKEEKTDVLLSRHEEKTDILPKTGEATDVLPVRTERSEILLKQAQALVNQQQTDNRKQIQEEPGNTEFMENRMQMSGVADIFEIEEDMTVLGGEFVSEMPETVLPGGISYENRKDYSNGLDLPLDSVKDTLSRASGTHILPNGINALASGRELEELLKEEQQLSVGEDETTPPYHEIEETSSMYEDGMEETAMLCEDEMEETTVLCEDGMEETDMLCEDGMEETDMLCEDRMEETDILSGCDATDILTDDEKTGVLADHDKTEPLLEQ